jgi:hypothetical protein
VQLHAIAHISHAELLTPRPEESLRFLVDTCGTPPVAAPA